jgi:predicted MFS family arabinose efflux permease
VGPRAAFRLLSSRQFAPYFAGNALSASGTWFQNLAAAILVFRLTGSELLLGVLSFAQFLPILLLAPWAGAAADRFDRRRLLLLFQALSAGLAGTLAALTALDLATAPLVIVFALGGGVATALSLPAQQALAVSLVPRSDIPSAVALNSMTFNIARALGPVAAAATIGGLGIPAAFAINAGSYLLFVVALMFVRPRRQERPESSRLLDALRLIRSEPRLAAFLLIVAVVGFASDPINTLAPAFAHEFGHRDTFAGFIIGLFGAGAVARGSRARMTLTLVLLGAGVTSFALSPTLWIGFPLLAVAGFGYLASNTAATSRLQLEVAESQRGRIMALWGVAFLGLRPFASLLDGAIASTAGVRAAGVALSAPALLAALALLVISRRSTRSPRDTR